MHNALGDVGAWLAIIFPCLPYIAYLWKERRGRGKGMEQHQWWAKNPWLDGFAKIVVAISSYWTFGAVFCSPGVILQFVFHYDFRDALIDGTGIGMGTVFASGMAFIWWDCRRCH